MGLSAYQRHQNAALEGECPDCMGEGVVTELAWSGDPDDGPDGEMVRLCDCATAVEEEEEVQ
jgi:hypothetical protein